MKRTGLGPFPIILLIDEFYEGQFLGRLYEESQDVEIVNEKMKIDFLEHVTDEHREAILDELSRMGASTIPIDEDCFLIEVNKPDKSQYVHEFLVQEDV